MKTGSITLFDTLEMMGLSLCDEGFKDYRMKTGSKTLFNTLGMTV